MQSARQKKKFSQQKKRHHDYSKAKGLVKGEASGKDDEEKGEKGKSAEDKTKKQATSPPSKTKDHVNTKRVRDNTLGSNWDRYEEPASDKADPSYHHQESEEQLQQRLVQLLNLPIQHAATPPHQEDTSQGIVTDAFQLEPEPDSFLHLDTAELAMSLSGIPLSRLLDISPELVQLCEMDAQPNNADSALAPNFPEIDLSICCARKREYAFEFNVPERSSIASAEDRGDQSPGMIGISATTGDKIRTTSEEDGALDRLLGGTHKRKDKWSASKEGDRLLGGAHERNDKRSASKDGDRLLGDTHERNDKWSASKEGDRLLGGAHKRKDKVASKEGDRLPGGTQDKIKPKKSSSEEDEALDRLLEGTLPMETEMRTSGVSFNVSEKTSATRPKLRSSQEDDALEKSLEGGGVVTDLHRPHTGAGGGGGGPTGAELDDMLDELLS